MCDVIHRLKQVIRVWQDEADFLEERHAAMESVRTIRSMCTDLEAVLDDLLTRELPTSQAANLTGYSEAHLRRLFREGQVDGRREGRTILLRMATLPTKAGSTSPPSARPDDASAWGRALSRGVGR